MHFVNFLGCIISMLLFLVSVKDQQACVKASLCFTKHCHGVGGGGRGGRLKHRSNLIPRTHIKPIHDIDETSGYTGEL